MQQGQAPVDRSIGLAGTCGWKIDPLRGRRGGNGECAGKCDNGGSGHVREA
ncbi:hypothetical protein Lokhon_01598 [Limimaricola hongkongensis DSM 17492]|uniref:Uncharacterized protein n=1 Tax=Limimaricola hongkongensis DSM 17492 TaxID=1122180 RepID=A0A017HF55_9RHOB|nr:hypothetical protein Lokhon_01598 [Limimaricola hongkongensis DSM 17492]